MSFGRIIVGIEINVNLFKLLEFLLLSDII